MLHRAKANGDLECLLCNRLNPGPEPFDFEHDVVFEDDPSKGAMTDASKRHMSSEQSESKKGCAKQLPVAKYEKSNLSSLS